MSFEKQEYYNQILAKVKKMLKTNTMVNWGAAEVEPNEEFQYILDEIEKMEKKQEVADFFGGEVNDKV